MRRAFDALNTVLLGRRQPREQRQDLGVRRMVLAQRLGRVADLALAGQEHQHVAGAFAAQFVDRVDDRVHQVAFGLARGLHAVAPPVPSAFFTAGRSSATGR
jgi:hypothetical protein